MPLLKGKKNIGKNIKELKKTGRSHKQAVAKVQEIKERYPYSEE